MKSALLVCILGLAAFAAPRFEVSIAKPIGAALDGRLMILLSTDATQEPRFQINDGPSSQLVFGVDLDNAKAPFTVEARNAGTRPRFG